jgi:putative flippase GtrA
MSTDAQLFMLRASWVAAAAQFFRYALVGVLTNVAVYLFYLGLTLHGLAPALSATASFAAALIIGFVLNRKVTFRRTDDPRVALSRHLCDCLPHGSRRPSGLCDAGRISS